MLTSTSHHACIVNANKLIFVQVQRLPRSSFLWLSFAAVKFTCPRRSLRFATGDINPNPHVMAMHPIISWHFTVYWKRSTSRWLENTRPILATIRCARLRCGKRLVIHSGQTMADAAAEQREVTLCGWWWCMCWKQKEGGSDKTDRHALQPRHWLLAADEFPAEPLG